MSNKMELKEFIKATITDITGAISELWIMMKELNERAYPGAEGKDYRIKKKAMKKISGIMFLSAAIALCACNKDTNSYPLGKYVFEDDIHILHVNEDCSMLKSGKDRRGHSIYAKLPIDTAQILEVGRVCSKCVNSQTYDRLNGISLRNKDIDYDRKWLYNKLKQFGYDMEEYEMFVHHLSNPDKRERLFMTAQQEGWDVGTYNEFSKLLGFDNTQEPQ